MGRTTAEQIDNMLYKGTQEGNSVAAPEDSDEIMPLMKFPGRTTSFLILPPAEVYQPTPKRSIFFQCGPLILREWRNLYRDRNALFLQCMVCVLLYTALGAIFWQRGNVDAEDYDPNV